MSVSLCFFRWPSPKTIWHIWDRLWRFWLACERKLSKRGLNPHHSAVFQLPNRRQKTSETTVVLGQDVRMLTNLPYPYAPVDVKETLARKQFIIAIVYSKMRLKLGNPLSMTPLGMLLSWRQSKGVKRATKQICCLRILVTWLSC